MLFNSFVFILGFLPVTLAVFYGIGRFGSRRGAALWLAAASFVFYCWGDPARNLAVLGASVALNFAVGSRLSLRPDRRLLALGVGLDLAALAVFKYADFAASTADALLGLSVPLPGIRLPIGISFFTFTQIAFLVDCHRGLARDPRPAHYALFASFFPHLVAGPLIHHRAVMPQFDDPRTYRFDPSRLSYGLTYFALGLFKKAAVADPLGFHADRLFAAAASGAVSTAEAWTGTVAYALQLYFDFSGYSDMAIGLALMFGVRLPVNFDSPYKAASIVDFWRRWHVTLSAFLRDYLYIPLGGSRRGPARRYLNLFLTMLLGGLWHGASWTFVLWGAIHGTGLMAAHLWAGRGRRLPAALSWPLTALFVLLAWVPFRAATAAETWTVWRAMLGLGGGPGAASLPLAGALVALAFVVAAAPNSQEIMGYGARSRWPVWSGSLGWAAATAGAFGVALARIVDAPTYFLYFRF
ncbi:MBOAT family O-acyltransferase [Lichenibacterium dinghuense]|uniref:MBOAT family O-acyltransferase n=1 Tax=Lichenibacterium dinghuense TaxID=2895977 RepID=UPI001F298A23|nr:MBOAT family protein [Lichenibacterium sp. 6Y81]